MENETTKKIRIMIIEISYKAKCKHCKYWNTSMNPKTKKIQSICEFHQSFIRKDDLACDKFEL
jgi:hypothetical protein